MLVRGEDREFNSHSELPTFMCMNTFFECVSETYLDTQKICFISIQHFNIIYLHCSAGLTSNAIPTAGPSEEEYESGNGPSLPQSPASLEPSALDSDDDEKLLAK